MTSLQQNRLSMILAVLGVMEKYTAAWTAFTAMGNMVTRLSDLADSIQERSGLQGSVRTGIAGGKRRKRLVMMEQALAIAAICTASPSSRATTSYRLSLTSS